MGRGLMGRWNVYDLPGSITHTFAQSSLLAHTLQPHEQGITPIVLWDVHMPT